jgi:hypothetical protein
MRRLAVIAVAAGLFAGCGQEEFVHEAPTEGIYVDVGNLVYQIQMSRYLNPADIEDAEYLTGLPEGVTPELPGDEVWFGVWMRVKNYTDETLAPATQMSIVDTDENVFEPVELSEDNPFAYNPKPLGPDRLIPIPDSAAASGPIQGSLILFRLPVDTLQNRPLKLEIEQAGAEPAEIDLDL